MKALSGGQKVKVVLAAALWNCPHILILDEPTNYLDRESLGALAAAIREFEGGVVMITHHSQFCDDLCPTVWHLENNTLNIKGDAEWMAEMKKEEVQTKAKPKAGDKVIDKFGNEVTIKLTRDQMTPKEIKALKRKRDKENRRRKKAGIELLDSDEDEW
jgi:elongation factor 3